MPLPQRNFEYYAYDSDDGTSYCLKADEFWGDAAGHGGSACAGEPAYGSSTTRRHPRKAIYQDPTTFRTISGPVFTPAAYAALTVGTSTLSVAVHGSATAVTYTLRKKVPEAVPSTVKGMSVLDHA